MDYEGARDEFVNDHFHKALILCERLRIRIMNVYTLKAVEGIDMETETNVNHTLPHHPNVSKRMYTVVAIGVFEILCFATSVITDKN